MEVFSFLFALLLAGVPPSFCAQPPGEADFRREAGELEEIQHTRSSRSSMPLSKFVPSHSVSNASATKEPLKTSALPPSPPDESQGPNQDKSDTAVGKDNGRGSGIKPSGFDGLMRLNPATFQNDFGSEVEFDTHPTATGRVADSTTRGQGDSLDPTVSVDGDALANAGGGLVSSFIEQIEAAMQPLFTGNLFSALPRFEDVLMPVSFSGPKVTSRVDDSQCTFEVNLQHLPDTGSLRVGVEGGRVFVEYADSVKRVSDGEGVPPKEDQGSEGEWMQRGSSTLEPAASIGYSEGRADVYSFETFQVPDVCDHQGTRGKAFRTGRDHLQITFPRKKSGGDVGVPSRPVLSEASEGSQTPSPSGEDLTSASESTRKSALPFKRRFMQQKSAYSTEKVMGLAGYPRDKPAERENLHPKLSEGRRYIPVVEEDAS